MNSLSFQQDRERQREEEDEKEEFAERAKIPKAGAMTKPQNLVEKLFPNWNDLTMNIYYEKIRLVS